GLSKDALINLIAHVTGGLVHLRTVSSTRLEIDVVRNDEFDAVRKQNVNGFLFYPYYLDVEARSGVEREQYIDAVRELLQSLWRASADAVPACDFEDELPKRAAPARRAEE